MALEQGYDSSICILLLPLSKVAYCTVSIWAIIDSTLALVNNYYYKEYEDNIYWIPTIYLELTMYLYV